MRSLNILKQGLLTNSSNNALKDSLRNTNPRQPLTDFGTPIDVQSSEEDSVYLTGRENPFTNVTEGGLNEIKANRQSWGVKASTGIARAMVKAGAEVLKMPGVIGGAIAAPFAEEGQGWDTFVNNSWINTIDEYNEKINEDLLPVYVKKAIKDGDLMDNLTSIDFWATEGADGAGFIASMFVPGALMKSFNIGSKITEIASMSKKVSQFQKMLGITPSAIDNFAITTANTIFEAASEAGSAMKSFEQDLNRKLNSGEIGEEEYNNLLKQKGELGRDMFLTNLAILAGPNMINTKLLYGVNKEAKQAAKYLTKDAEGKLIMNASKTLKGHLGDLGKGFIKSLGREGFFEEGLQSTTENYFKKQASKGELTGNYLDNINLSDFGSEYLDMLSTVEGQKAIALGGILGSPLDFVHGIKQENRDRKETSKLLGILEHTNDAYLATTIKPDIWKRTEEIDPETGEHAFEIVNGKKVIDPVKRNEVIKKASNSEEFGKLFDIAQELNNTDALTMLQSIAEDNLITPMIMNSNLGMDVLTEHLKNNPSIPEESKKRILEKASVMQKAHNDFQNFSQPILKLDNKNADVNHKQAFYNLLNQSLLINTSQQFQANQNLDAIKRQITEVLASKGLTDDIASSVKNNYASTDIRLRKLYDLELENEEKIKKLKEEENTIWDSKEQKKAFDKYVEKSNDLRANESPEKIEKATEKIDKINNAKTVKDVADAVNNNIEDTTETETTPKKKTKKKIETEDNLDPQTEAVITKMGDDKIGEITAAQNAEITQGNDEVIQDVKDNKESILNDVREFNNVIVDGKEFIFINAFGLVVMNTMDNSVSESFENIEQAVEYIENLLNKNVVNEEIIVKEEPFEVTSAIHTDQIEGDGILKNDEKNNEQADVKRKPTINTTGVDRKGNIFEWLPEKFKNWLVNLKNKKGTPVTFSLPEVTKFSYDKKQVEAVKMLQSGDFTNKDFLYRHLPLQVDIEKNNFTFIATLQEDVVEEGTERYVARKNIVDAIINNSGKGIDKYKGITSTIDYQKGGELNYIQPKHIEDPLNATLIELVENNISALSEFNNNYKKVPLYFVKDEQGNVYDENKNDATSNFPSNLTSNQKGYVYTVITAHNGVKVPVKMNVKKLELQQAYLVYEVYKSLYLYNKENKVKLNQNNAKLTDLYSQNTQLKATIEKFFEKELSLFKNQSKITVADFMTVFIHDNLALDGTTKPYTTKYKGAGITFGEENFINFEKESSDFKDAFIDFLTTKKRQNVKLDFLGGTNNIDKNKYKDYLINNKVINVNLDIVNPFKGDINVYVSSDVKSENPKINTEALEQARKDLQEGLKNVETPNDTEAKKANTTQSEPTALRDVESTAKALEGKTVDSKISIRLKENIISILRNRIFDLVRGTELYNKYRGSTIPYEFSENSWSLLKSGVEDSGLNIKEIINEYKQKLKREKDTPVKERKIDEKTGLPENFNPSTGMFEDEAFGEITEKENAINKTQQVIYDLELFSLLKSSNELISEAYHKAKADGSNPELVKAVESLLSKEQTPTEDIEAKKADTTQSEPTALRDVESKFDNLVADKLNSDKSVFELENDFPTSFEGALPKTSYGKRFKVKKDGREIGSISLKLDKNGNWGISYVDINKNERRKGYAEQLYKDVNKALVKNNQGVLHSDSVWLEDESKTEKRKWILDGKELTEDEITELKKDIDNLIKLDESGRLVYKDAVKSDILPPQQLWEKLVNQGLAEKLSDGRYKFKEPLLSKEQATSSKSEIEAKKADMERRRQGKFKTNNLAGDLRSIISQRLVKEGISQEERSKLIGTSTEPIITSAKKEDVDNLLKSYEQNKEKQLKEFDAKGEIFNPETGNFVNNDTSFWDNKIDIVNKINAEYDAEYVDAVKKGEMTKEQAMQALEEAGRKNSRAYAELAALENNKNNSQNTLISENKDVSLPPGSKGGRFSKKNNTPSKPDGFSKKDC